VGVEFSGDGSEGKNYELLDNVVTAEPEPSAMVLTLAGGVGLVGLAWRRRVSTL